MYQLRTENCCTTSHHSDSNLNKLLGDKSCPTELGQKLLMIGFASCLTLSVQGRRLEFEDGDSVSGCGCLTQFVFVPCCMEQKAQNSSTSGILILVWVILAWTKLSSDFVLYHRADKNPQLFQDMTKHMGKQHLVTGLLKGLTAEWALQKAALHLGLVLTC